MLTLTRTFRRVLGQRADQTTPADHPAARARALETAPIDIAPNDPILAHFPSSR